GLDFVGFDLVEVYPQYDPGFITSLLAANIIFEFISLIALNKKEGKRRERLDATNRKESPGNKV
ncbi:arginase family protein, partial [Thermococcus sp.]